MYNAEGSFARKQLEKHGWTAGSGLGSSQQGISQAIRVKIKHDTTGVGHDPVKEFSHHWWDHAFNKAAASLVVESGEDGVVVKKKKTTQKERSESAKKALYGNFIKSSLLDNGTETRVEREGGDPDTSDDDDETKLKAQTLMMPDEELLQKCGGRTAHKGARHGLKLNGKLARIQEQERLLMEKNNNSSTTSSPAHQPPPDGAEDSPQSTLENQQTPTKRKKKSKKRKREEREEEEEERVEGNVAGQISIGGQEVEMDTPEQSQDGASVSERKKKKKKKRKKERAEEESKARIMEGREEDDDGEEDSVRAENGSHVDVEDADAVQVKKRKKKSKTASAEEGGGRSEVQTNPRNEEVCLNSADTVLSASHSSEDGETRRNGKKCKKKKSKK
ncbi:uncharacterized protein LOC143277867 [Babylonia areolata]|uniref:uncharacterized protein LOC143277867 n=1 Tax=Babylonia areolata TaxID=304850 RepID=UPI003FD5339E